MHNVFNRYDIRGNYPNEIDNSFAFKLGKASATFCRQNFKNKNIVVGFDTRKSSPQIKTNLINGIISSGVNIIDIGISTTDKVALAGNYYNASFSIMITASHNSFDHNGFKFIYKQENGFSNQDLAKIKNIFCQNNFSKDVDKGILIKKTNDFNKIYEEKVYSSLQKYTNINNFNDLKIVVDCCNSCASLHLINLLKKLKCNIVKINCNLEAQENIEPEPTKENRQYVSDLIKKTKADIGIGVDPDADRVFAFDKNSKYVNGNEIFCLLAELLDAKKIIASIDTSSMLQDYMGNKNRKIIYSRIGDIFVSQKAIKLNADFLGEPNGHYAFPEFCWYNSGIFACLLLCSIASQIPEKINNLPKYRVETKILKYPNNEEKQKAINKIKIRIKKNFEVINDLCGIKFRFNKSVCLIRASGTEALIRIIVEKKI
ncbi:MAG: hypothetical protein B6U87_02895 [Candidatus Aenigmarchaeota archaeon ex4484_52]|nr:MAG: hypothetical protein B6U87_02895 [Candidatus Aenigmarchaeota archaeon ex4484_52]